MRKHNFLKAVAMTLAMALLVSGTAFAATPGQALDGKEVKYGTVSSADARVLRTMFDAEYYAKEHEDVAKIVGNNANALFNHFLKYGIFEGRAASKDFNVSAYKSSYGDLQKAFGNDIISYYLHYAKFGKTEKRELITVEKAEAAGVTIQSVVPGATKTVLTPKQEAAKSSSSSSSSGSEVHAPITSDVYYFNGTNIVGLTQAEFDELVASAEEEEVEMLSDTFYSMTVHYRADNATAWTDYKAAEIERNANVEADMAVLGAISVNAPNGANEATVLGLINDEISGLSSLNFSDWTASEIISGYTATTAGSQSVSVLFDTTEGSSRVPVTVTVVVAEGSGGPTTYTVTNNLTNVTSSNAMTTLGEGEPFSATLTAESGYEINSVTVTMGGVDVTSTAYNGETGVINLTITGNVVITATASLSGGGVTEYTVTATLTGCTSDAPASVEEGDDLVVTLTASQYYTLEGATVTVTVDGVAVDGVYNSSTNEVTLENVEGDVVITAIAQRITYSVTYPSDPNVTSTPNATTTNAGEAFTTTLTAAGGYTLTGVTVTMGGSEVNDAYNAETGVVSIAAVTGDIVIMATAESE